MGHATRVLAAMTLTVAIEFGSAQAFERPSPQRERCFGAASRDPDKPCHNSRLRLAVVPRPAEAAGRPNSPCRIRHPNALVRVCEFGVRSRRADGTVVLLGDSHAAHWRAALEVVARAKRWRGLSLMRPGCPFTVMERELRAQLRRDCIRWKRQLPSWLARHRQVHTVFMVAEAGGHWRLPARRSPFAAQVNGFVRAWRGIPRHVTRIVVIHDTPRDRVTTAACVERAIASHRPAATACAIRRSIATERDPAVAAVKRLSRKRFASIDMTRFFCSRGRCFPVVGGALVHKDTHHLTVVFARTLGPYLLRRVNVLMR